MLLEEIGLTFVSAALLYQSAASVLSRAAKSVTDALLFERRALTHCSHESIAREHITETHSDYRSGDKPTLVELYRWTKSAAVSGKWPRAVQVDSGEDYDITAGGHRTVIAYGDLRILAERKEAGVKATHACELPSRKHRQCYVYSWMVSHADTSLETDGRRAPPPTLQHQSLAPHASPLSRKATTTPFVDASFRQPAVNRLLTHSLLDFTACPKFPTDFHSLSAAVNC
uniref:Prepilin-type N-terminal cleavage/methylation domain-containing protein n=1 Tax=Steinernema glaseri TaxID=37863 RepID=A0A1I7YPP2_9BILA